jgi:thiamine-monophosphate kinase
MSSGKREGQDAILGEFDLIERFFSRSAGAAPGDGGVILGIGDDAALLRMPAHTELVAAVDTLVEGRHFPIGSDARSIGHRALAVNLSDLAAMGALPTWATLALTMPSANADWLRQFSGGLLDLADAHGVALVGGDTTRGPLTISVQLLGQVPPGTALRRSGASPGDVLAVTGTLGDAGAGLALVDGSCVTRERAQAEQLIRRFEYPTPRVKFGLAARGIASAAMDLSDGLVGDLPRLASASGLAARVDVDSLPLSPALRAVASPAQARDWALAAGDDYELLIAAPPHRFTELQALAAKLDLGLAAIGDMRAGRGVTWILNGREFAPAVQGYDHFR